MSSSTQAPSFASGLSKLSIDPGKHNAAATAQKPKAKKNVADSWEDEDVSSGPDDDSRPSTSDQGSKAGTAAPPPTPISPNYNISQPFSTSPPASDLMGQSRRPEKTDAVARRMIAGALGVKAPKATEEQKAYEKAIREKEKKRREEERDAQRNKEMEAEKAKKSIWED